MPPSTSQRRGGNGPTLPTISPDWFLQKLSGRKSTDPPLTATQKQQLIQCAMPYLGAFVALLFTGITVYVASTDDKALTEGFFKYAVFTILPIVFACFLVLPIFKQQLTVRTLAMNGIIAGVFVLSLYFYYQTKNPASVLFMRYFIYAIVFLAILVFLAIVSKINDRFVYNQRGWPGIIYQILFVLPCLIVDAVEYIQAEMQITPKTVYVLLGIEAILIGVVFLLPRLYSLLPTRANTDTLLVGPVFLDRRTQLSDYTLFAATDQNSLVTGKEIATQLQSTKLTDSEKDTIKADYKKFKNFRTQYTVSFWAFVNKDTGGREDSVESMSDRTVFAIRNFSNPDKNLLNGTLDEYGNPRVAYNGGGQYTLYLSNGGGTNATRNKTTISAPLQKWNFFVLSYDTNKVDVFINGNLEKTATIDVPTYDYSATMSVGSNGLSGAICNVKYRPGGITAYEIVSEYNGLMYKNPPVP